MKRLVALNVWIIVGIGIGMLSMARIGLSVQAEAPDSNTPATSPVIASAPLSFGAIGGPPQQVTLGSTDKTKFKFEVQLDSKGAGLRQATLSEYNDLMAKDRPPLLLLEPARTGGLPVLSLANRQLILVDQTPKQQLGLDRLDWKCSGIEPQQDGSQTARFDAWIVEGQDNKVLRLTKTYKVSPESYLLDCTLDVENLSKARSTVYLHMAGPAGIRRESILADMPKGVGAFKDSKNQIVSPRLEARTLLKAKDAGSRLLRTKEADARMLWVGISDKYFAAILVPQPDANQPFCDWVRFTSGLFFNPDADDRADSGDETVGLDLQIKPVTLEPAGDPNSTKTYRFQLYLGPKDKTLFDKDPQFRDLGFIQVIDFSGCCCPASIINPLAFLILAIMKGMQMVLFNYGLVIIVLVLLMRLVMHPVTKKSQIAMSKMGKLAPKAEEIKKKYAGNKAEMNKQLMALYREQGASPIMGFIPMLLQMPIWIALWSAVNSSIDLRGARFLPIWITDLSAPDALISFSSTFVVPLLGLKIAGINLLPLLMGVAFYLQQKFTPTPTAATNPQIAQQQKMMMWMMPIMFPLMLYNTASGVNLYIMTSTFAGVWEQKIILKHIKAREAEEAQGLVAVTSKTGGKVKKKRPKPFFKI
jgi:YidC/Oxa1 family membrane protein insertase